MSDRFEDVGYGGRKVGFGERPAILTVDFQLGFTHPDWPSGRSPHIHRAVENTARLLAAARPLGVPVISCNVSWGSEREMGHWKVDALFNGTFFHGHPSTRLDPRIHEPGYDMTFTKSAPSIFFLTPLTSILVKNQVDTVIICGCTTSGCVRASIIDAFSFGYRTIVPEECVGDMEEAPHRDNLRDVGRRYADIVQVDDVIRHLRGTIRAPLAAAAVR